MYKANPCLLSTDEGIRVTMSIGVACPLKCKHCYQEGKVRFDVDLGTNLNSLVKMGESGVSKLYWDGAEPMTNPDIDLYLKVIQHMKKQPSAPKYLFKVVSIATNGVLVTYEKSKHLYDNGLRNIMVSLDGATSKTNDYFRDKGAFNKAVNAISILTKIGFDVRIGTTIWRGNIYELEDIVKLGINLGVKEVAFNWLQPIGQALKHPEILVPNEYYQSIANKIRGISYKYENKIKVKFHRDGILDERAICKGGTKIAYISGEWVWPCSWISIVAPEFKSKMSLSKHTLKEILEKDTNIKRFRKLVEKMSKEEACCPALCKIYNGSFIGPDPISSKGIHQINQKELK